MRQPGREQALAALDVSRETAELLDRFVATLGRWRKTVNLISEASWNDIWMRHILDSGQLVSLLPPMTLRWIDIGSGAGFPGLIVAILLKGQEGARVDLIESDRRKAAFLAHVSRETGAPAIVHAARAEIVMPKLGQAQAIVSRAAAALPTLVELSSDQIAHGAVALFMKGEKAGMELTPRQAKSSFRVKLIPSRTSPRSAIVWIQSAPEASAAK